MSFQLTISEGREAGKEFVFTQDSVFIGRSADCDVALQDPGVSRKHCRIFRHEEAYAVEDQGSANGTLVNGSPVSTQQVLEDFEARKEAAPPAEAGCGGDAGERELSQS